MHTTEKVTYRCSVCVCVCNMIQRKMLTVVSKVKSKVKLFYSAPES